SYHKLGGKLSKATVITGATVDRVPLERFPEFPAALPRLQVQQRIADILSAYDDLIETTVGGWPCWRRRRGSSTASGSSASASPATSTPASPAVCRKAGSGHHLRPLSSFSAVSICQFRIGKTAMCRSTLQPASTGFTARRRSRVQVWLPGVAARWEECTMFRVTFGR